MRSAAWSLAVVILTSLSVVAQAGSVLQPPVLPLIVRNPYLSTWLPDARKAPWENWPMFYTGEEVGLSVLASVGTGNNNTVYPLLGRPQDSLGRIQNHDYNVKFPNYLGASYDASITNLTYQIPPPAEEKSAASVQITISFLCPVTPTSTLRQSLPACYLSVIAEGSFDVNLYVDVNGQWVSGQEKASIEWSFYQNDFTGKGGVKTWKIKKSTEELFTETADRAEWGTLYFSGPSDFTHESGSSRLVRPGFVSRGNVTNIVDPNFRGIMDKEPIFAFSKTFNLSGSDATNSKTRRDHALFTIAHVQDPIAQYASPRGLTYMRPLWKSWFAQDSELIQYHYKDFASAWRLAQNYSDQLKVDAFKSGSNNYVDIVALSARQVMGATSFSGTPESPLLFLKEISSDGNSQTVDVIFPSAPFFLYTNPRWLAYLLEPLLEHQLSGLYPNKYSMHDMGTHFPNITGHSDGEDEYMPLEECGNMLIMGLAMANSLKYSSSHASNSPWSIEDNNINADHSTNESTFPLHFLGSVNGIDKLDYSWGGINGQKQATKWLSRSYSLWKQWTGYLVDFSLEPHNQLSTDDFAGWLALQTNLALKGIVGIKAMSEIASLLGQEKDAKTYANISGTYIAKWQDYGISRDGTHAKLAYNWYGSWTTLYSLYADALLCFHPSITGNAQSSISSSYTTDKNTNTNTKHPHAANAAHDSPFFHTVQQQHPLIPRHVSSFPPTQQQHNEHQHQQRNQKDFIPHAIYTNQSAFYALAMQTYGLPLDSRHLYTKSDWQFQAAAVASPAVRSSILDRVARWINETVTDRPLTDLYETEGDGGFPEGVYFMARPVVGGHFAFLALERACGGGGGGGGGGAS